MKANPFEKPYHFAAKIRFDGGVSPLCADVPRAINLKRARWTLRPNAVTCKECKKRLAESQQAISGKEQP